MLLLYNIVQIAALLFLMPLLVIVVLCSSKYRGRIPRRLGFGLAKTFKCRPGPRVWIHALSVGEAASVRPLVESIRRQMPEMVIIFSSTTGGGSEYATKMSDSVDLFVPFPFDLIWVVRKFIKIISPDLFVLVETDFWPNFLGQLHKSKVPCLLANGRITARSFRRYRMLRFLFLPLFKSFTLISMQMQEDAQRLLDLGVSADRVISCGNLKYDAEQPLFKGVRELDELQFLKERRLLVAGSTHPGEEKILFAAFAELCERYDDLFMVVAPRDIDRGRELVRLAEAAELRACQRTVGGLIDSSQVLVLDTLGELSIVYQLADVAFVGGSLVCEGGHNPLEPAILGKPVLVGPHMEDFAEIRKDLVTAGGALVVTERILPVSLDRLLGNDDLRVHMGGMAQAAVEPHRGAVACYLKLIKEMLNHD